MTTKKKSGGQATAAARLRAFRDRRRRAGLVEVWAPHAMVPAIAEAAAAALSALDTQENPPDTPTPTPSP